ncbi:putative ABC transport system permease protein [Sphingobium sp. B2D3A]|uniref:ABC transporter permease n=1 Tax=unclassified Sphingobium TaxID=2611147 RepID=UPI002224A171|nr:MULTISPECIES: FtsX-like permease family protein [unclassified Sphingobium]MCW2335933.1 putative ABC transport system permease protein [Sphingobium sp. B2D3A]MCW2385692.1 putative ABC transport system permease protein [Sphingobium sp. B2D3D]
MRAARTRTLGLRASWSIARRDLNAGLRGLRLLFVCLFLGVATLAAIGSLTTSITSEIAARGQTILGGDIEARMSQREASEAEKQSLRALGTMSETIRLRAMANAVGAGDTDGPAAVLTELKGVDGAYPLYGKLLLREGIYAPLAADRIMIGQALAERLQVRPGGALRYGTATFTIAGIIAEEPDRVGEGFTLGPVAIVSLEGLRRTGLIQPGSLYESKYRVRVAPGTDVEALRKRLEDEQAEAGWSFRDRENAAPGTSRFIERMGQFLSLIGLTALVIAGIGVSNGVSSYLAIKRGGIATFKVLGATSADIERIYLMQIGTVATIAITCGLIAGALLPPALIAVLGDVLPVQPGFRIHPLPLITSAAYGLLIAYIFTLPPLDRARTLPVAAILRAHVEPRSRLDRRSVAGVVLGVLSVLAIALGTAREPLFSAAVLGATAAVLGLLLLLGWGISALARRVPRPRRPLWRLAIANLYRPGAQTSALVIALGLALTLFVTLAGVQTSLTAEIDRTVPKKAPNQFVLDIPSDQETRFRQIVAKEAPAAELNVVPALRGRIVAYAGQRVADMEELPEGAWFLRGERGVTYSATLPEGSDLVAGQWWAPDYVGPPLISLDEEAAKTLNLKIGDSMTVSVLGREIEAKIASLRKVNWDSMGFNYVMVISPSALASAPHSLTATITMDEAQGAGVTRALLAAFPGVSVIAVAEVVEQISGLLEQMSGAIVAAASIAIFAGVAVLIGAIAASRQARSYDSVILKTLGATRWQILGTQAMEYALLAATLALVSLALGMGAAWYVIVQVFEFGWAPDWGVVLATLAGGAIITLGIGLAGSIPLMSLRPSRALREL